MELTPAEGIFIALKQISRAMDLHSRALERRYGLTGPQLLLLRRLEGRREESVSDLARRASLSQATVTDVLDRLESRGLVTRRRSESDRRRVMAQITAAGIQALAPGPSLFQDQFMSEFGSLQTWEQTLILSSLQRVAAMLERAAGSEGRASGHGRSIGEGMETKGA